MILELFWIISVEVSLCIGVVSVCEGGYVCTLCLLTRDPIGRDWGEIAS